jgi:hypothetical protein
MDDQNPHPLSPLPSSVAITKPVSERNTARESKHTEAQDRNPKIALFEGAYCMRDVWEVLGKEALELSRVE